tara:strand:+ start:829 stop:1305 length:477 start_codon:yes stop_codon:yes gene_type:complete
MELFIVTISFLLLLLGVFGSIFPIIPGPPFSLFGILLLHFYSTYSFDSENLFLFSVLVILITFLDVWLQIYGVKKFGGGKRATNGALIGLVIGFFVLPLFGIILGPFLGAYIGAKTDRDISNPFKVAVGSLIGFLTGTILKLITSIFILLFVLYKVLI